SITGLTANTLYYIRAYATNANGTAYGNQRSFTTLQNSTLATVTTDTVTAITQITATSGGNVTSDGGATVTGRGVCWNISQNPTISNSYTTDGSGTGKFTSYITDLKSNTLYYVRAYATNINGTAYGNQQNFTTLKLQEGDESTDTIIKSSTLELYPDPVRSTLTIAFYLYENSNINLSVYGISGIKMYNEQLNDQSSGTKKMQLNTSSFIEGLYTVVITTDKMVITKNFIKLN
ncbi:MAG: T9SS type A sorting domain-containing protein, partial [Bacteroidales bacterium]